MTHIHLFHIFDPRSPAQHPKQQIQQRSGDSVGAVAAAPPRAATPRRSRRRSVAARPFVSVAGRSLALPHPPVPPHWRRAAESAIDRPPPPRDMVIARRLPEPPAYLRRSACRESAPRAANGSQAPSARRVYLRASAASSRKPRRARLTPALCSPRGRG